jgi:hypothetical protein
MPAPSGKTTIVDSLSSRLSELGIELPKPPTPLGACVESSYTGNLLFLSGTLLVEWEARLDAVAALNPTEQIKRKTIIRIHP